MNPSPSEEQKICFPADRVDLAGFLSIPEETRGLVVFVHGSGSSRFSSRNQYVATEINKAGVGTLLFDLLTSKEQQLDERTAELRFDIELLTQRLLAATAWLA